MARVRPVVRPEIAALVYPYVVRYKAGHMGYRQNLAAREMQPALTQTALSNILNGYVIPTPREVLAVAHYYDVPLEEFLHLAGYPTLAELREFVKQDASEHNPRERDYILKMIEVAQRSVWYEQDWRKSVHKEAADEILASAREPYEKAARYADQVYYWGVDKDREKPRWGRRTDEIVLLSKQLSHAS